MEKMFTEMLNQMYRWMQYAQNFMEKTFTGGSLTMKFVKVSFLLHGTMQ